MSRQILRALPLVWLIGLTLLATGCVTGNKPAGYGGPGDEVVERSKLQAPAWISEAQSKLIQANGEWRVITMRTKLLNLPLGLKQTQLVAIDAAPAALAVEAQAELVAAAGESGGDVRRLTALVRQSAENVAQSKAKVADLYYEKIANRDLPVSDLMSQYFSVYVLVTLPQGVLTDLFRDVARSLDSSSDPGLKRLVPAAKRLAQRPLAAL